MRRAAVMLLALAACADAPAPASPPAAAAPAAAAAPVTRFDGTWSGSAVRSIGTDIACGAANQPITMNVVRGRAAAQLPRVRDAGGALGIDGRPQVAGLQELIGTVAEDGGLLLRVRLEPTERAEGRFGERGFSGRFQSRGCAWNLALSRIG